MRAHYFQQRHGWRVEIWRTAEHAQPFVTEHESSSRESCEAFAEHFIALAATGCDLDDAHRAAARHASGR